MKIALAAFALLFGSVSQAAIAVNYGCTDGQGTEIGWELRPGGSDKIDRLYGEIDISVNEVSKSLEVSKYKVGNGASLKANLPTGEYVKVKAKKIIKDEGDKQFFSGKAEFLIKLEDGLEIKREVDVQCEVFGEA